MVHAVEMTHTTINANSRLMNRAHTSMTVCCHTVSTSRMSGGANCSMMWHNSIESCLLGAESLAQTAGQLRSQGADIAWTAALSAAI